MGTFTKSITQTMVAEECCACGIAFMLTRDFQRRRIEDHQRFYCPNGHGQSYCAETKAEKADRFRKQAETALAQEQTRHAQTRAALGNQQQQTQHAKNKCRSEKAAKTRIKNRIANGVCPCCNRTFVNLGKHMKNQHPDFTEVKK